MELKWVKIGKEGPGVMLVSRSLADERNRYEIAGTEGFWYGTFHDNSKPNPGGSGFNLGWAPTLEMIKERCQILENYKGQ